MVCYDIADQDQKSKIRFSTARQSQFNFKMANRSKYDNFNFVVEYPLWVSIKRTLTGMLAVSGRKFIYCAQFGENIQKLSKSGRFQNSAIFECF